jgi:hypothetical protein
MDTISVDDGFVLRFSVIYSVAVPALLFTLLFLFRLLASLTTPIGPDSIVLLVGIDTLVPAGQLQVSGIAGINANAGAVFTFFIIVGVCLMALSVYLEKLYIRVQLSREKLQNVDATTLVLLVMTFLPAGIFISMHLALLTMTVV